MSSNHSSTLEDKKEAYHRIGGSKKNVKKVAVCLYNRRNVMRALHNKKILEYDLCCNTKLFTIKNLADCNKKLTFKFRKLKRTYIIHSIYTSGSVGHIMKSDRDKFDKHDNE